MARSPYLESEFGVACRQHAEGWRGLTRASMDRLTKLTLAFQIPDEYDRPNASGPT